MATKAIPTES